MKNYPLELIKAWAARQNRIRAYRQEVEEAEKDLENLRLQGRTITPAQIETCRQYAIEVFGDERYAPWLRVFTAVQSRFREGWIPTNYYVNVVIPKLKGQYAYIGQMKSLASSIFPDIIGPDAILPDIAYFSGGHFLNTKMEHIPDENIADLLFEGRDRVVFKKDGSLGGRAIFFINRSDFHPKLIRSIGMGVFQTVVRQHPTLAEFNSHAVTTLRVNTVMHPDGTVSVPLANLRISIGTHTHVTSVDNIRVFNLGDGVCLPTGSGTGFKLLTEHPDTGKPYAGFVIPKFREALDLCIELQKRMPYLCSVGWDVAIDSDERVRILEYNTNHNGFIYGEAMVGPCFKGLGWENLWKE